MWVRVRLGLMYGVMLYILTKEFSMTSPATRRCLLSQALPIRPPLKLDTGSVAVWLASLWSYYKPTATVSAHIEVTLRS